MQNGAKRYLHNIPAARNLRQPMTETETLLWEQLRNRRLGGLKFRRQHAIHRFVVDFYCSERRLAVEVDGEIHNQAAQRILDAERQSLIEELGVRFLRFTNHQVLHDLPWVLAEIARQAATLSPSPAQSGEGVGG